MRTLALLLATLTTAQAFAADPPLERVKMPDGYTLTAGPKRSEALTKEVAELDKQLFDAIFTKCDPDKVATLVVDDLELHHDKWGFDPNAKFVDGIRGMCKRVESGEDFRARRELKVESLEVYPMQNFGAFQLGEHTFYRVEAGKPDVMTESGKFAQLWKRGEDGKLRLSRVVSYDHVLAPGGEPVEADE
jgi:hypothetical protein